MSVLHQKKEKKRNSLLEAAHELFLERGQEATSVDSIVERARMAKGTFYLFPGVEKTGLDDKQFCKELLERAHVLVSAGSPFGKTGANHFRIACTVGIDQLKQAFDRMEKLEF